MQCFLFLVISYILILNSVCGVLWSAKQQKNDDDEVCTDILTCQQTGTNDHSFLSLNVFSNGESHNGRRVVLTEKECFHPKLSIGDFICAKIDRTGCSLHNKFGGPVDSCASVKNEDNIFVVAPNCQFIWPSFSKGHITTITHIGIPHGNTLPIQVETISEKPKIFRLINFFSAEEADRLVANAMSAAAYRLKSSVTGSNEFNIDNLRTSENTFDTTSIDAMTIKKRGFELLGIRSYDETMADGIQVLRYNQTDAYGEDLDWIQGGEASPHNWDAISPDETNRFASILLYLSDVEEGGETIFPEVMALKEVGDVMDDLQAFPTFSHSLMESNLSAAVFPEGTSSSTSSRQRGMKGRCESPETLTIQPKKAEAILYYSQLSDGSQDKSLLHGVCPVIKGQKWVANIRFRNGPRDRLWIKNELTGKKERSENEYTQNINGGSTSSTRNVLASFESFDVVGAQLFWEDQFWDTLPPGVHVKVNTFPGHVWKVWLDGQLAVTWLVGRETATQRFVISSDDLPSFS